MNIEAILWNNQGQVLTPELIVGILYGASQPEQKPDKALIHQIGDYFEEYEGATFQVERLSDPAVLEAVQQQHQEQWDEVERARKVFNPDYPSTLERERDGIYVLFTARRDGVLIGNVGCYLLKSVHNQLPIAREDTMYVVPEERKGLVASKFFDYCEHQLRRLGVMEITITTKKINDKDNPKRDRLHIVWMRKGYEYAGRELTKTFYEED